MRCRYESSAGTDGDDTMRGERKMDTGKESRLMEAVLLTKVVSQRVSVRVSLANNHDRK